MLSPSTVGERPLFTHLLLMTIALLCGTGVWLVVQLTEIREQQLNIPIRAVNLDPSVVLTLEPTEVPVRFAFPVTEQHRMQAANFWVEVDFAGLKERIGRELEGDGDRTLLREFVRNSIRAEAANITAMELLTPQIRWNARLRWARGRVVPEVVGAPAAGFRFDPQRITVETQQEFFVLVSPELERELRASEEEVVTIPTEPIDITGREDILSTQVALVLPPGVSFLPGEERMTRTVVVEIVEETITREIKAVPVTYDFVFSGEGLRAVLEPAAVDVLVTGRLRAVNALRPSHIKFSLFGVSEKAGERREVALETRITDSDLRARIQEISTTPRTVTVSILDDTPATVAPPMLPTPAPTPAIMELNVVLDGGASDQRAEFANFLRSVLPPGYELLESGISREGAEGFRIFTAESMTELLNVIVESAGTLSFPLIYQQQTDTILNLTVEVPTPIPSPTPTPEPAPETTVPPADPLTSASDNPTT